MVTNSIWFPSGLLSQCYFDPKQFNLADLIRSVVFTWLLLELHSFKVVGFFMYSSVQYLLINCLRSCLLPLKFPEPLCCPLYSVFCTGAARPGEPYEPFNFFYCSLFFFALLQSVLRTLMLIAFLFFYTLLVLSSLFLPIHGLFLFSLSQGFCIVSKCEMQLAVPKRQYKKKCCSFLFLQQCFSSYRIIFSESTASKVQQSKIVHKIGIKVNFSYLWFSSIELVF